MELKNRIRDLRKARGLSQERLARQADLSLNLIGRLEGGQVTDPHYSTLRGLAHALGVPVEGLVREPALAGKAEAPQESELTASLVQLDKQPFPDVLEMDDEGLEDLRARARDEKEGRLYAAIFRAYGAAVEEHDILLDEGAPPEELAEAEERRRRLRKLWKVVLFERLAPRVDADPQRKPDAPVQPDTRGLSLEEAFEAWRGSRVPVGA